MAMKRMYFWMKMLRAKTTDVKRGSSAPSSRKIPANTGMTFHNIKMHTRIAKDNTAEG